MAACRECGREFPDLPLAWRSREIVCGPCSVKPKCRAPEPCPTPDLCADFEGCCWPEWTESNLGCELRLLNDSPLSDERIREAEELVQRRFGELRRQHGC